MSGLDPTGPSQPKPQEVYETSGNAVSKEPAEKNAAQQHASSNAQTVDRRSAADQQAATENATATSLGRGIRGAPAGEEAKGKTEDDFRPESQAEDEKMHTYSEKDIYEAVAGNGSDGRTGEQPDLTANLQQKKEEQAPYREAIKESRSNNVDVGGILGQRGGPADSTYGEAQS